MPRQPLLPPYEEIHKRKQEDPSLTDQVIAAEYGVTPSSIANARAKWRKKPAPEPKNPTLRWPWVIRPEHTDGGVYRSILAYRQWLAGEQLDRSRHYAAMVVRDTLEEIDAVITYDQKSGFAYAKRRPEDGDRKFVVR